MDELAGTEIVIARHGNTFDPGDEVLRCGARTDLHLSGSGRQQAVRLGRALAQEFPKGFDAVYVSTLKRTQETARIVLETMGRLPVFTPEALFDEIDYGPDEGQPESQVQKRLGVTALAAWDDHAVVPPGWICDPAAIRQGWRDFLDRVLAWKLRRTLVVTSNGVARFAVDNVENFKGNGKCRTGAYGVFVRCDDQWQVQTWDRRPTDN